MRTLLLALLLIGSVAEAQVVPPADPYGTWQAFDQRTGHWKMIMEPPGYEFYQPQVYTPPPVVLMVPAPVAPAASVEEPLPLMPPTKPNVCQQPVFGKGIGAVQGLIAGVLGSSC